MAAKASKSITSPWQDGRTCFRETPVCVSGIGSSLSRRRKRATASVPGATGEGRPTGIGDGRFQSYCFRLCLTEVPGNSLPIERRPATARRGLNWSAAIIESGKGALGLRDFIGIVKIPNGKADINSTGPVSTDLLGASWEYPEATYERRKQIWDEHLTWAQGLIYFLQNDGSVPEQLRSEARHWNLPKDEFPDTGHWPHQLYIREGRRMLGEYVLTQHDLEEYREKYDAIGMAGYNIDIREVQWLTHKVYHFPKVVTRYLRKAT